MKRIVTVTIAAVMLVAIVAVPFIAAGCGGVPDDAIATVGDTSVPKAKFNQLMNQAKAQAELYGYTFPSKSSASYKSYAASIVSYLVQAEVVAQGAESVNVKVTDEDVQEQVDQINETYGGEKKVLKILKQQGMTMALLKLSLKNSLLSQKVSAAVTKSATVSDDEISAYWKAHADKLRKKAKTATFEKAKKTIKKKLLNQKKSKLWKQWLADKTEELGIEYATGYNPEELTASPSPSASASSGS